MNFSFAGPKMSEIRRSKLIFFSAKGAIQLRPRPSAWVLARQVTQVLKGRSSQAPAVPASQPPKTAHDFSRGISA